MLQCPAITLQKAERKKKTRVLRNLFHKDRKKGGEASRDLFFFDKVFNTWTDGQGDTVKFHTIVVTKGRQLAARFTYSRGSGPERKAARVYFRRKASGPRGYMCVSHGGSRQRLASGNKLRVVLFTSSRKLDTKAGKKERRQSRMPELEGGAGRKETLFHASLAKTRTDTFTYFSARHSPLPFFLSLSLSSDRHSSSAVGSLERRLAKPLAQFTYLDIESRADGPVAPCRAFHRFYDALSTTARALIDSRVPDNFHFLGWRGEE